MERLRSFRALSILLIAGALQPQAFGNVCVYKPPTVGRIRGRIMDRADYPIPQAQVTVLRGEEKVQTMLTDETGEFSFDSLSAGKYYIDVGARGFQHARYILKLSSRKNPNKILRITLGIGSIQCQGSIEVVEEKLKQRQIEIAPVSAPLGKSHPQESAQASAITRSTKSAQE